MGKEERDTFLRRTEGGAVRWGEFPFWDPGSRLVAFFFNDDSGVLCLSPFIPLSLSLSSLLIDIISSFSFLAAGKVRF